MSGINLAQGARQEVERRKKKRSKKGTLLVLLVVVLVLLVWGGLAWYEGVLTQEIRDIERQITAEQDVVSGKELNLVADAYFRLDAISGGLEGKIYPQQMLALAEATVDPGVVLTSYAYSEREGVVTVKGEANEYADMIRQLVSLKKTSEIEDVSVEDMRRTETGTLGFTISFDMSGI